MIGCCQGGEIIQGEEPLWEPLLRVVGERLTGTFMWMYEVELDGGLRLHAYKHIWTRSYVFLSEQSRAYQWTPCGRYAHQRLDWALEAALCNWWTLAGWELEDAEAIREAIARANATSSRES